LFSAFVFAMTRKRPAALASQFICLSSPTMSVKLCLMQVAYGVGEVRDLL
jgi:hypothetical protein